MIRQSIAALLLALVMTACEPVGAEEAENVKLASSAAYMADTRIEDVVADPVFGDWGRLIFPVQVSYYCGETLEDLNLTWYRNTDPAAFGGDDLPRSSTVVMQYTGLNKYSIDDPPTYACVGTNDGIAGWQLIKRRVDAMAAAGIDTEFHAYEGLGHGFGLGIGTVAEGWINDAIVFWENHMESIERRKT
ncbi:MAG: alpha/beta hydrolase [Oscillibacter sp.]|nr:alpha/beta hydrolase [Oscillibacter sp.]